MRREDNVKLPPFYALKESYTEMRAVKSKSRGTDVVRW